MEKIEKFFKFKELGTDAKTETIAGLTTFLSMAYVLAVNPSILASAGMDKSAVFTATAVSAAIATLIMAFYANYPVMLASGMGLNAYFAYSVCMPMAEAGISDPWQIALTAVFVEGIIFIILSLFKFREMLVNEVPANLKLGITAGIGLFIAIVGLKSAGIVISDSSTVVAMGDIAAPEFALALIGLLIIGILWHFNVTGYILWGILITWGLGIIAQLTGWYVLDETNPSLIPSFGTMDFVPSMPTLCAFNFEYVTSHFTEFAVIVFSFLFVDLFDTVGTLIGVASKGNLLDENGTLPRAGRALMADAIGTVAGACLGTSTVSSYVESSAGVAQGGRSGFTALVGAVLFILSLFLSPIFLTIPTFATTPALVFVGLLMASSVKNMDFEGDKADVVGGFVAMIMMPFTYSIANGIMFGMLFWVAIKVFTGKIREVHPVMWISAALFAARIISLVVMY